MPTLTAMGKRFHDEVKPEWPWSGQAFEVFMGHLIGGGYVAISGKGFIAGMVAGNPLNPAWMTAYELLWFGDATLSRPFRKWAKSQGANEIKWSCRDQNIRVKRFYQSFSRPVEAVYSELI